MSKLKPYISLFLLLLLAFPAAEKVMHEFEHLGEDHCDVKELHFCETEHHCSFCDFVFTSSAVPPLDQDELNSLIPLNGNSFAAIESAASISLRYTFSLRGPPAC